MDGRSGDDYLTAARVYETYQLCALPPGRAGKDVHCWQWTHTFDPGVLMRVREDIARMLLCLQAGLRSDVGGGGSVANMVLRDDGTLWTQDMGDVERLIALGMGIGLVTWKVPERAKWPQLPGGLPYVQIEITAQGVSVN